MAMMWQDEPSGPQVTTSRPAQVVEGVLLFIVGGAYVRLVLAVAEALR